MKLRRDASRRSASRGFSIVEMLVAVVIGMVVAMAAFGVLSNSEGRKRTAIGVNDANQSGAYAVYALDRVLRSAGTGFSQGWAKVGGCRLNAAMPAPASETWPRAAALPAPFAGIPQTLRLAPVVIFQDASAAGSDVLMVMSGAAGFGEAPAAVQPLSITATQVLLANTIGFRANDLVMLSGGGECLMTQVAATKPACAGDPAASPPTSTCGQQLPLGGSYYTPTGAGTSLATLAGLSEVNAFVIGNSDDNRPQFQLFGVGADNTLFSHDMLLLNGSNTALPVAEGVVELRAVYGIDSNADGILDSWADPGTAPWTAATLMNGSSASNTNLRNIVAVRVGLVMRSSLIERDNVAPASLPLFADLPSAVQTQRNLSAAERKLRHRTIELTIPVRNLLLRT